MKFIGLIRCLFGNEDIDQGKIRRCSHPAWAHRASADEASVAVFGELLLDIFIHRRSPLRLEKMSPSNLLALVVCLALYFSPLLEPVVYYVLASAINLFRAAPMPDLP